jgi:hypothetical protein
VNKETDLFVVLMRQASWVRSWVGEGRAGVAPIWGAIRIRGQGTWVRILKVKKPSKVTRCILQSNPSLALPRAAAPTDDTKRTLETPRLVGSKINESHI